MSNKKKIKEITKNNPYTLNLTNLKDGEEIDNHELYLMIMFCGFNENDSTKIIEHVLDIGSLELSEKTLMTKEIIEKLEETIIFLKK